MQIVDGASKQQCSEYHKERLMQQAPWTIYDRTALCSVYFSLIQCFSNFFDQVKLKSLFPKCI